MLQFFFQYFIPESLRGNPDVFRRARLIVTISLTLAVLSFITIIQGLFSIGFTANTIVMVFAVFFSILGLFLLKNRASVGLSGNYLTIIYLLVITFICYFTNNGLKSSIGQYFFLAAPIIAALANGIVSAWSYTVVVFVINTIFFVLNINEFPFPKTSLTPDAIFQQQFVFSGILDYCFSCAVHSC
jgi:hypothetical protein